MLIMVVTMLDIVLFEKEQTEVSYKIVQIDKKCSAHFLQYIS